MKIDSTKFGSITIDGQVFSHDVYVLPSGKIEKRNKKDSPRIGGHRSLGFKEIKYLLSYNPKVLVIGIGQSGVLPIQEEAQELLENAKCEIIKANTPDLLRNFNQLFEKGVKVSAIFHTTC